MTNKERFLQIYNENIHRDGADKLLDFLTDHSDFFTAPASTRYHNSFEGGLLAHSLNVYDCLKAYLDRDRVRDTYKLAPSEETVAVVSLLHDICKVNLYRISYRNSKNEQTGQWEKVPFYSTDDTLPYGHGEKSVYMISGFMRLSREEAMAIRWHMGFSDTDQKNLVSNAFQRFPLALALSTADMESTYFLEE